MSSLRQVLAIIRKDLAAELHTREVFSAMFVFGILALLIFSFALDLQGAGGRAAAPGVLWTTVAFAGTLGLSRSMAREQLSGGFAGLLLAADDRTVIFFGKASSNLVLLLSVIAVLLPLGTVLLEVNFLRLEVGLIMLLGTLGYAAVGTLLAGMAVNTRAREVMLPILLLPLTVPLLLSAVRATEGLLAGLTWPAIAPWIRILIAYDLILLALAILTFEFVIEA